MRFSFDVTNVQQNAVKAERLACLGAMSTIPTTAMETLLSMPPLHSFIENEAMRA